MGQTVFCIGRNYREHAAELGHAPALGEPIIFLKSIAALRPLESGPLAFPDETFHHEAEIVVRIGRSVRLGAVAGWEDVDALALGLDLTRRQVQNHLKEKGLPWTAAKSFAGAAPLGPFEPRQAFGKLDSISFTLHVNQELRQSGESRAMIFGVPALLSHLAQAQSLEPGDLVFTGTPAGVGPIRRGDTFALTFTQLSRTYEGRL